VKSYNRYRSGLTLGANLVAIAASAVAVVPAHAQTTVQSNDDAAEEAGVGESGNGNEIVVTGSRIERAGFDQPTPTTVLGDTELRQGARANLQQVLNDQPQVRPTITPAATIGNTSTGLAPVDLRGLGTVRTLTLLNGRRFVGENNLNFVPLNLVDRLEVVTGGASAAWGSGAVAGVINILLKDDLEGLSLGAQTGISSRGDGERYSFDASFGTHFADGKGHVMVGVEYVDDRGIPPSGRNSRRNLGSGGITTINGQQILVEDLNGAAASYDGLILNGILAGQTFNRDGTLRAFRGPDSSGVGGEDASALYDYHYVASPFSRLNAYGRVSFDLGNATIWADASYGRVKSNYPFFPDFLVGAVNIQADNPFLSQAIRNQLASVGQTSFSLGRVYTDILPLTFDSVRENKEGAIGIDGTLGNRWKYNAHFSHGEVASYQAFENSRLSANFTRAIDAVSSGGNIVCRVNADANPANDDPSCRPLNIFGQGNASSEAIDYVTGTQTMSSVSKLDSAGVEVQGDLFSLWAGPVTIAAGAEARWEEQSSSRDAATIAGGFGIPVFTSDLAGGFNVKEGFAEIVLPLLDTDALKLDANGAARYSDYSNSGGIWSWKVGGTARLFGDLLLRATRSRDIRSPNVTELFSVRRIGIAPLIDLDTAGRKGVIPGYTDTPATVTTYSGGNPDLVPEISSTLTFGGSYSPSFFRGFNISVDYYDIEIKGAISNLSASNLTAACAAGSQAACDRVIRDPITQTVVTALSNSQNIASFATSGFDFEAAYVTSISQIAGNRPGSLRFRLLANYVEKFVFDTGVGVPVDTAGDVGSSVSNGVPKWRGTLSATYQDEKIGLDARIRYVGGGLFNQLLPNLVNNKIDARTYVDIGAQFKVADKLTFFGNISNLFDVDLPLTTTSSPHYDSYGRYFTVGARVNF